MKNLLYALGFAGSALIAGNSYSQSDSIQRGDINVEKVSIDVNAQSEYGKSLNRDFLMNAPHKLRVEKLTREELELYYLDVAVEYKKILEELGNIRRDYEANKSKLIYSESQVKTLNSEKATLQQKFDQCNETLKVNDLLPKEDKKK